MRAGTQEGLKPGVSVCSVVLGGFDQDLTTFDQNPASARHVTRPSFGLGFGVLDPVHGFEGLIKKGSRQLAVTWGSGPYQAS